MTPGDSSVFDRVIAKLERSVRLEEADREALRSLPFQRQHIGPNRLIVQEGEPATRCCVLLDGYAYRHKVASNGGRQIVSFHMAGDILDLQHLLLTIADHNVQTLTAAEVAWVPTAQFKATAQRHPTLSEALWRDTLIDASIFREWVLNVGRRNAKSRIAHLLCEFAARRELSGLGPHERFELPMTQEQIADATGLTPVHVSRMLSQLEASGAIVRNKRQIEITNWGGMCRIADFHTTYLHVAE